MSCHTNMSQMDADEHLVEEIISDWMADEFKYGEDGETWSTVFMGDTVIDSEPTMKLLS